MSENLSRVELIKLVKKIMEWDSSGKIEHEYDNQIRLLKILKKNFTDPEVSGYIY